MALGPVRTFTSVPTTALFASGDGSPLVVNDTPGSVTGYILNASGNPEALGGSAGAAAFTEVFATGFTTVRASVTTSLRVSASTNITINLNATANAITISAAGGAGEAFPVGSIYLSYLTTDPSVQLGYGTWAYLGEGQMLVGMASGVSAFNTVGASGGATSYTALTKTAVSGTNAISLTRDAVAGTNAISLTREAVAGSNAISLFREAAAGTNAASNVTGSVSVDWPAGVPTFAGTTASASASVTWPTGVPTNSTVTVSVSVDWPTGKPTFNGLVHRHETPIIHTDNTVFRLLPTSTFGVGGTSRVPDVRATVTNVLVADVTNSGVVMLTNSATASGTISWPASVPLAVQSAGHVHTISWPASVPQANVTGLVPAGVISWPASAPVAGVGGGLSTVRLTAAAQVFTGVTGSVSAQTFTGVTASVSGQIFTGVTASVSGQVFTGLTASSSVSGIIPPYVAVCIWRRTA